MYKKTALHGKDKTSAKCDALLKKVLCLFPQFSLCVVVVVEAEAED